MVLNIRTTAVLFLLLAPGLSWAQGPRDVPLDASEIADSARRLVSLLDYVAADYGGAVAGGKVVSDGEYREMLDFGESVRLLSEDLQGPPPILQAASVW